MQRSYLDYAMSVIVSRALPDVRDGLKPVHRRVLYAMYDGGYRPEKGFYKCARVVGDVMGTYHPHGDSSIYDALVRLAQPWSMRMPLVDSNGNFGSPGNDPAAAMRYTECKLTPLSMEMVRDIDEETVDFTDNYDGRNQEPTVLPARFPNLLINGSAGIAVGMATNIPPHNLREVAAPAGTGKTFAMSVAREAWQAGDIPVLGCALSARAAEELNAQTQIPTSTVATMTHAFERGYAIPQGGVLVVDEAGMIGTRDLAALAEQTARAEGKLVLVGDDRQLPEIAAGGAFSAVARRVDVIELRDVHRQRHAWDRDALSELRSGELERFADAYVEHARVVVTEDASAARERMAEDWWQSRRPDEDSLMLALRRSDVAELNAIARQKLRDAGELLGPDATYGDRSFAVGDRVITTKNDRVSGAVNGRRGTVTNTRDGWLSIEHDGDQTGHALLYGDQVADGVEHAYAMTVHRAQGATVDRTYVLADDTAYREWAYTALSRHRESASLYVSAEALAGEVEHPDTGPADGLTRLLSRSHAKTLAVEPEPPSASDRLGLEPNPRDMGMVEAPGLDLGLGR